MGTKRSLPQLCLEREHNFNYRSWPHCLGNVVGARARGKKPSSLSAKFSARVSGTKAFARSQPRKEDQGRGEGISNPLLSSRLASPRLTSPLSFTFRVLTRGGVGMAELVGLLTYKKLYRSFDASDTVYTWARWKGRLRSKAKRREFHERFLLFGEFGEKRTWTKG